jgi:hypothetical protein
VDALHYPPPPRCAHWLNLPTIVAEEFKPKAFDKKRGFNISKIRNTTSKSKRGSTSDKKGFFSFSKIRNATLKEKSQKSPMKKEHSVFQK